MPYYKSSQEWLDQSKLLLEARPSTTRITTKFSIKPAPERKSSDTTTDPKPPRGSLVIKTFDPVSGVTLKYRTTKAAEVTRLIQSSLGKLGRGMAGMPEVPEESMTDAAGEAQGGAASGQAQAQAQAPAQTQPQQGAGGKKKRKGKK